MSLYRFTPILSDSTSAYSLARLPENPRGTFFGTSMACRMLSYREVTRGVLMRTIGFQPMLSAAFNGAAAGLAVVAMAILTMWLLLVSY
jgi:hypothetical protein